MHDLDIGQRPPLSGESRVVEVRVVDLQLFLLFQGEAADPEAHALLGHPRLHQVGHVDALLGS